MMRYTGPKDRISRREGVDIFGKKVSRLNVPPGVHGPKGLGKQSEFGKQLREKQKAKRIYGVSEKQFSAYVEASQKNKNLTQVLERRLDNVVYRLGFAPTRPSARQLVSHCHILVNGRMLNIPSYTVLEGDTVSLDAKSQNIAEVKNKLDSNYELPSWLERKAVVGRVKRLPAREDVQEPFSEQEIIEFYSR
ncbi:MAG: 30S ribosomal protein S4 [Candidatus Blackburnbacteria bacterium RIFCSPHIGHO2_01_FULL_43_15b]|uniref:Small ribosomal subunit protein uS4 n=1 Tax=Candidatus Blackburnbacteria bacterium RIFCSPHIGHO2_01_FULL_43_15b TaxID=1797513 RepID=A0A1G1UYW0_9BACT|nr:MAG: 30S ribosomal protein S4 [Candidatus Blackburnbacteria bacterium RIFCSPHIGHO2_01_FULL_43_15b]